MAEVAIDTITEVPDPGLNPNLVSQDTGPHQISLDSNQPLTPVVEQPAAVTPADVTPAVTPEVTPAPTETPDPALEAATETVEALGMDITKFRDEFVSTGDLSEESFTALAAKGLPKEIVQEFIAGQVARQQLLEYTEKQIVGGPEKYASMVQWAAKALSPAEIEAFNKSIFTPDAEVRKLAITGLHARYEATLGQEPQLLTGDLTAKGSGGFRSQAEITRAMSDPRYENDEAYRNDVIRKLALDL